MWKPSRPQRRRRTRPRPKRCHTREDLPNPSPCRSIRRPQRTSLSGKGRPQAARRRFPRPKAPSLRRVRCRSRPPCEASPRPRTCLPRLLPRRSPSEGRPHSDLLPSPLKAMCRRASRLRLHTLRQPSSPAACRKRKRGRAPNLEKGSAPRFSTDRRLRTRRRS